MWHELTLKLLEQEHKIKVANSATELAEQLHHSGNVVGCISKVLSSLPHKNLSDPLHYYNVKARKERMKPIVYLYN